jgi:hypothetical protein
MEDQAVEHFTIAELAALARFYATPEGASVMRKMVAFGTVVTPAIQGRGESRGSERSPPGSARNPHPAR